MLIGSAIIQRAYRLRAYPRPSQAHTLRRLFGARGMVWNWALRRNHEAYRAAGKHLSGNDVSKELTQRRHGDWAWLQALPVEPFVQTLRDYDTAWSNFFQDREKGRKARYPARKRHGAVRSARFKLDQRRFGGQVEVPECKPGETHPRWIYATLPGVGRLKLRNTYDLPAVRGLERHGKGKDVTYIDHGGPRFRSVTLRVDAAGRWFACLTADRIATPEFAAPRNRAVGVDLGLKSAAMLSDGNVIDATRAFARKRERLRRYQRHYSRQYRAALARQGLDPAKPVPKGTRVQPSRHMADTRARIARLQVRVADTRRHAQHGATRYIVNLAGVIGIEDLSVRGMGKALGRGFRRNVHDAGMGEIRRQLEYKGAWAHRAVVVVDRFFPSSKTCHKCRHVNRELSLKQREWDCPHCHTHLDRDRNAAINLRREALRLLANGIPPAATQVRATRMNRESNARGTEARTTGAGPARAVPTAKNRERNCRAAKLRSPIETRLERVEAGAG